MIDHMDAVGNGMSGLLEIGPATNLCIIDSMPLHMMVGVVAWSCKHVAACAGQLIKQLQPLCLVLCACQL